VSVLLVMVGFIANAVIRTPKQIRSDSCVTDFDLSLVILFMIIAAPMSWYHYFVWLIFPLWVLFSYLIKSDLDLRRIGVWLAVSYGLVVVQGIGALFPAQASLLQNSWWIRLALSQSAIGSISLLVLTLYLRTDAVAKARLRLSR
jgi:hypothetical protein